MKRGLLIAVAAVVVLLIAALVYREKELQSLRLRNVELAADVAVARAEKDKTAALLIESGRRNLDLTKESNRLSQEVVALKGELRSSAARQ